MMWKCSVCGYVHDGENPPESCPKCGAPKEKFEKISEEASRLIERSRFSNSLHMALHDVLETLIDIGEAGIEDNLDPGCVAIFTKARDEARVLQQMIKAEIVIHINKGKWG